MLEPEWWWRTDAYDDATPIPESLHTFAGPEGLAVVEVYGEKTQAGWGGDSFMENYTTKKFKPRRALWRFTKRQEPFAFVMRSLSLVCIDIDGKNGGFLGAPAFLGNCPRTLTEISKSGNGYHLFYSVPDSWDQEKGFARIGDSISIVSGVDIRGTGCVYHHATQRWNDSDIAPCPQWILDKLESREQFKAQRQAAIESISTLEPLEQLMMHEELKDRLSNPIPAGKRNNTLFAIGSDMKEAGVVDWDILVGARAEAVGLDPDEVVKLIGNIDRYATSS